MNALVDDSRAHSASLYSMNSDKARGVPFIVRVAGLPASVALAFESASCREAMEALGHLTDKLTYLRAEVTEKLASALPSIPADLRRRALEIKRHCFNGREISHFEHSSLDQLRPWVGGAIASVLYYEEQFATLTEQFRDIYGKTRNELRELLVGLGADCELWRGLTLASRDLANGYHRLGRTTYPLYGRKERRAERSLARYITRAAVKTSPYSTLTKVGLGLTTPSFRRGVRFIALPWEQRSIVRLKSYLPYQWEALLLRTPQIREILKVEINNTLEDLGGENYRLLRPLTLQWDEKDQDFRFATPSLIRVTLKGPLVKWLRDQLNDGPIAFSGLCSKASIQFEVEQAELIPVLDQFLDIGLLRILPPWPSYEPHPERRILEFMETLSDASLEEFEPIRRLLRRLIELEETYATAPNAAASLAEIEELAAEIFSTLKLLLHPGSALSLERGQQNVYEDVFLISSHPDVQVSTGEIVRMSQSTAESLFEAASLFWRIRSLYERRHECLHALWHVARELFWEEVEVPCLRFFDAVQATWKLYIDHLVNSGANLFNPYNLSVVRELGELRKSIAAEATQRLVEGADGFHLSIECMRSLLVSIPSMYQSPIGPCLLTQPTDPTSDVWVANGLGDGSGRVSGRFNTLMDESTRDWFTGHFEARSIVDIAGEPTELLDLLFTQQTTINRHWPQTRSVFESPGELAILPKERRVNTADLVIEIGKVPGTLQVKNRNGRRYIPCFLSALHPAWIPTFIKFLTIFGIDTRGRFDIATPINVKDSVEFWPRLTIGSLIIRRKRWNIPAGQIPISSNDDAATFVAIWRWRTTAHIPERVFWSETRHQEHSALKTTKPQFIDFTSPTLVSLFICGVKDMAGQGLVLLEEALPLPENFPKDDLEVGWGTELVLERLAFETESWRNESRSASPFGEGLTRGKPLQGKE